MDTQTLIEYRRNELVRALAPLCDHLASKGFPIHEMCLTETYPGVSNTPFEVRVSGTWMGASKVAALDLLIDTLFEVVPEQQRSQVFSILAFTTDQDILGNMFDPPPRALFD